MGAEMAGARGIVRSGGERGRRRVRERGIFGIRKTNYVVKTTELGEKLRVGRGEQVKSCAAVACWRTESAVHA